MGLCYKSQSTCSEGSLPLSNVDLTYSTNTCFEPPYSVFFATERYMGLLPRFQRQNGLLPWFSQFPENYSSGMPSLYQAYEDQAQEKSLCSVIDLPLCSNQDPRFFSEKPGSIQCKNPVLQNKLVPNDAALNKKPRPTSSDLCKSSLVKSQIHVQLEKQYPKTTSRCVSVTSNKGRIRWSQDLHERFVGCVNRLGGAENAKPKAILKLMESDELTIFHVKSHLQKYRFTKYVPESTEGQIKGKTCKNEETQLNTKAAMQITEALQLQLDVQRSLHEQLKIQQHLQKQIEEQGRQLKQMLEQQQKVKKNLFVAENLDFASQEYPITGEDDFQISSIEGSEMS